MKKTISIFILVAIAFIGFLRKPIRHNGTITLEQIIALADGDSEDPDDEYPPPPPPPGMPQPPPDTIPPYVIPVMYFSNY